MRASSTGDDLLEGVIITGDHTPIQFFLPEDQQEPGDPLGDNDFEDDDFQCAGIERTVGKETANHERAEDIVQAYFHSMGNITILTRSEELELAKRLEEGKEIMRKAVSDLPLYRTIVDGLERQDNTEDRGSSYDKALEMTLGVFDRLTDEVSSAGCLTKELEGRIESAAGISMSDLMEIHAVIAGARQQVAEAKDELIMRNLRLVVNIARNYAGRGLPFLDLIQEGNIGLIKAVDKFKYEKGFKFSTYATWWIRQGITRAIIDQTKTVRVPVHIVELYNKVNKTSAELAQELRREPSDEEVGKRIRLPESRIADIRSAIRDTVALQTPIGDENTVLEDFLSDDNAPSPCADAEKEELSKQILAMLKALKPNEEKVIRMRFGIGVDRDHTLEEVGRHLMITRERVRQIEVQALRKLRSPVKLGIMADCSSD